MRILYLCADLGVPVLGRKGASLHVRALAKALTEAGHEVALVAPRLVGSHWERPAELGVAVTHLPPSAAVESAGRALKTFRDTVGTATGLPGELRRVLYNEELRVELKRGFERTRPDVVYERASLFGTAGSLVAAELGVPHIVELNAPLALEQGAYRAGALGALATAAERFTLVRAHGIVAVSESLREHAVRSGARAERVRVLPNGVDIHLFHPGPRDAGVRERLGLPANAQLVGFVGGLRPWHGVESLPELLATLTARFPDLRLAVAGEGPFRGELEAGLARHRVGNRAHVLGAVPHEDVAAFVRELDVALAPYPDPGHDFYFSPLKLFEYMACGTPVVASALGQIAQVVRDGETGLLVPPGDGAALAAACERLLADRSLGERLGAAGAAQMRERYTWGAVAKAVAELATDLIERRRAAA